MNNFLVYVYPTQYLHYLTLMGKIIQNLEIGKRLLAVFQCFSGLGFLLTGLSYNSVGAEVNL